jgi:hypothetical protein
MTNRKQEIAAHKQSADGRRHDLDIFESGHVPSNKRSWEVHQCNARLRVADYDGTLEVNREPWTEITIEEYETYESGRSVTRSISITLKDDMRRTLIDMLSREPQPVGSHK